MHLGHRAPDAATVERLHDAGFAVMAYTVDDPRRVALVDAWGVYAVCTNRLDRIRP